MSNLNSLVPELYKLFPHDLDLGNGLKIIGKGLTGPDTLTLFLEGTVNDVDLESLRFELKISALTDNSALTNLAAQFIEENDLEYVE